MQPPDSPRAGRRIRNAALVSGLIAGSLDLVYICTFWALRGVGPVRIAQSVAAGWVGREAAFEGGAHTATLGLLSHYAIAAVMALAFLQAAKRFPALARRPLLSGPAYGVLLYFAMNYVVVPLSAAGGGIPDGWNWMDTSHLAAHVLLVGTPIACVVAHALRRRRGD